MAKRLLWTGARLCKDGQNKSDWKYRTNYYEEEWKYSTNYFKNHWNKENFGPIIAKKSEKFKAFDDDSEDYYIDALSKKGGSDQRKVTHTAKEPAEAKSKVVNSQSELNGIISCASFDHKVNEDKKRPIRSKKTERAPAEQSDFVNIISKATLETPQASTNVPKLKSKLDILESDPLVQKYPLFNRERTVLGGDYAPSLEDINQLPRDCGRLPSVSKVLNVSMPPEQKKVLVEWERRMRDKMGDAGFELYKKNTFARGHRLHSYIENTLLQAELPKKTDDEVSLNHIQSMSHVLGRFSRPLAIESHTVHPDLGYHGFLDCVAHFEGNGFRKGFVLVDWKTSEKKKRNLASTYDNPLQLAAYAGALNHDPRYKFGIECGILVIVYNDGADAEVLHLNKRQLLGYWIEWLKRLKTYKEIQGEA